MTRLAFALLVQAGCWQMSIYAGPRVDAAGGVGAELGVSMGGSAPNPKRTGALVASVDTTLVLTPSDSDPAGSEKPARATDRSVTSEGAIRGVVEWTKRPQLWDPEVRRVPGIGWRAGVYAGAEIIERSDDTRSARRLIGATATVSPWMWGGGGEPLKQFMTLGFQLAADVFPDPSARPRFVIRAALVGEGQFWPKIR